MRDPKPSNIKGQKVQRHVFKHEIQWGYVALGVSIVVVMYVLSKRFDSSDEEDQNRSPLQK